MYVSSSDFKTHCLEYFKQMEQSKEEIVVTRRGKPIARVVPVEEEKRKEFFGRLKDSGVILGDIMEPIDVEWEVMS